MEAEIYAQKTVSGHGSYMELKSQPWKIWHLPEQGGNNIRSKWIQVKHNTESLCKFITSFELHRRLQ